MTDDIIKNPKRQAPKEMAYTPEYVRRGLTPIPAYPDDYVDGEPVDDTDISSPLPSSSQDKDIIQPGEYVLMVKGKVVMQGAKEKILAEAKDILYSVGSEISSNDLIVLKRIELQVGVYLND